MPSNCQLVQILGHLDPAEVKHGDGDGDGDGEAMGSHCRDWFEMERTHRDHIQPEQIEDVTATPMPLRFDGDG